MTHSLDFQPAFSAIFFGDLSSSQAGVEAAMQETIESEVIHVLELGGIVENLSSSQAGVEAAMQETIESEVIHVLEKFQKVYGPEATMTGICKQDIECIDVAA